MTKTILGIVGGSGVYDIEMDNARWEIIESPWGEPSDCRGTVADTRCHQVTSTTAQILMY